LKDVMLSQKDRNARTLTEWLASPDSEHFLYTQPASLKA
jgi:hypothetical protein